MSHHFLNTHIFTGIYRHLICIKVTGYYQKAKGGTRVGCIESNGIADILCVIHCYIYRCKMLIRIPVRGGTGAQPKGYKGGSVLTWQVKARVVQVWVQIRCILAFHNCETHGWLRWWSDCIAILRMLEFGLWKSCFSYWFGSAGWLKVMREK